MQDSHTDIANDTRLTGSVSSNQGLGICLRHMRFRFQQDPIGHVSNDPSMKQWAPQKETQGKNEILSQGISDE
jgi:hypothetical protein